MKSSHIHFDANGTAVLVPVLPTAERKKSLFDQLKQQPYFVSILPPAELKNTRRASSDTLNRRESSSLNVVWTAANYHRLFCAHDRARWAVCSASTCRRDKHEAAENWLRLLNGELK